MPPWMARRSSCLSMTPSRFISSFPKRRSTSSFPERLSSMLAPGTSGMLRIERALAPFVETMGPVLLDMKAPAPTGTACCGLSAILGDTLAAAAAAASVSSHGADEKN